MPITKRKSPACFVLAIIYPIVICCSTYQEKKESAAVENETSPFVNRWFLLGFQGV